MILNLIRNIYCYYQNAETVILVVPIKVIPILGLIEINE